MDSDLYVSQSWLKAHARSERVSFDGPAWSWPINKLGLMVSGAVPVRGSAALAGGRVGKHGHPLPRKKEAK